MVFDPHNDLGLYLKAMASQVAFTSQMDPVKIIGDKPTFKRILDIALEAEKDSVIFYAGMKKFAPAPLGADKIEAILQEEIAHVAMIMHRLAEIK